MPHLSAHFPLQTASMFLLASRLYQSHAPHVFFKSGKFQGIQRGQFFNLLQSDIFCCKHCITGNALCPAVCGKCVCVCTHSSSACWTSPGFRAVFLKGESHCFRKRAANTAWSPLPYPGLKGVVCGHARLTRKAVWHEVRAEARCHLSQ